MLQDIFPHIFDNAFSHAEPCDSSRVLAYKGSMALVGDDGSFMTYQSYRELGIDMPLRYLFSMDGEGYYLCLGELSEERGYHFVESRKFREMQELGFIGITGASLSRWYNIRRFCGCCGSPLVPSERERAMVCPRCGLVEYPKISPAVIVGVRDGDRLLLTRNVAGYRNWALVAGYCEVGESLEGTVAREVLEETGVRVKNIRYFGSQPWGFSDSMLMGFFCDLDGSDELTIQEEELAEARWFHRDELPDQGSLISLTSSMIESFKKGEN